MKKVALLLAALVVCLSLAALELSQWWRQPAAATQELVVVVGDGSSLSSVAAELSRAGILSRPRLWGLIARFQGLDGHIKRGEYALSGRSSPAQLLEILVAGRVLQYSVTFPEGITLSEALGVLHKHSALEAVLESSSDPRLLDLVHPATTAEGQFFPDTYYFFRGNTDLDVLRMAYQRMQKVLASQWAERAPDLPYTSAYEALIMASVVEKETGVAVERTQIAGVFVRRLQQRMRLQTDPTVIYGLGVDFDGNLRRHHLADRSNLYNTYQYGGLPPTPIALPGTAAIFAALHPVAGSELYFVARGDGSHQFSETLEQHQQAVRDFQHRPAANYRSTPLVLPPAEATLPESEPREIP